MTTQSELYNLTLAEVRREIGDELPYDPDTLYEAIRNNADARVPDEEKDPLTILKLAVENPGFATDMVPHWRFTEWQEAGNSCTPIALIRENIYQWLLQQLEEALGDEKDELYF